MFLQRISRIGGYGATAVALILTLVPAGFCQTSSVQDDEQVSPDRVEEIVVYGEKSITQLRRELHKAQDNVYDVFNLLNDDDEYDVHCYTEAPIGSHIRRRICRANFVSKATAMEARGLLTGQAYTPAWTTIQQKNKLLREKMEAMVVERPELLKALSVFSDAKQTLDAERQRRCEGRILICRR